MKTKKPNSGIYKVDYLILVLISFGNPPGDIHFHGRIVPRKYSVGEANPDSLSTKRVRISLSHCVFNKKILTESVIQTLPKY